MKESIRRERKIPKFRPLPTNLKRRRTLIEAYGRFTTIILQIREESSKEVFKQNFPKTQVDETKTD